MALFRRRPVVFEAVQILEDAEVDFGGTTGLQLIRAGEWVLTLPDGNKTMVHDVVFQREFIPQGP